MSTQLPQTLIFREDNTREGMEFYLFDDKNNLPANLNGASIRIIVWNKKNKNVIIDDYCTILQPPNLGRCYYQPKVGEMATAGEYSVELSPIIFGDGTMDSLQNMTLIITKTSDTFI